MKNYLVIALAAFAILSGCQPEEISPPFDLETDTEESFIIMSNQEVDALLVEALGTADFSVEFKLAFLSEYHVEQVLLKEEGQGRGAANNSYIATAQVYDGVNYFTDVNSVFGTNPVDASISKAVSSGNMSYGWARADVHLNRTLLDSDYVSETNLNCGTNQAAVLSAQASWSGAATTSVDISCTPNIRNGGSGPSTDSPGDDPDHPFNDLDHPFYDDLPTDTTQGNGG